jgi:6-phosphogluconate dehydrogenase (decarboxylating)
VTVKFWRAIWHGATFAYVAGAVNRETGMTIKRVGLIGAGFMGHGIGKNVLAKGYQLVVMAHRNRGPVDDLIARGASERASSRAIAEETDMVILCVTGTPQIEALVYGESGLLGAVRPGLVIADCSTAEPASTMKIAADVEATGGHFVDTPMTRTPKEAESGTLGYGGGPPTCWPAFAPCSTASPTQSFTRAPSEPHID